MGFWLVEVEQQIEQLDSGTHQITHASIQLILDHKYAISLGQKIPAS